jgi:fatty acid desaturase
MRVHGQWLDLTGFAHPGGPVALGLGAGRDATVLFESHHPFASSASLRSILDARRVPADEQATLDALFPHACVSTKYDFDFRAAAAALGVAGDRRGAAEAEGTMSTSSSPPNTNTPPPSSTSTPSTPAAAPAVDAFEAEIKSIFRSHFEAEAARRGVSFREATKATPRRWAELVLLGLLFLVGGVLPLVGGWYPALVIAPTLGWVWMVNSWHDASHFALSTSWLTNSAWCYLAPWFSSPLIWGHQHIIGHHAYTNVPGADPDLYHAPKLWRFQSSLRWTPMHAQQAYLTPLLWALSVPTLLLLKPLQTLATGTYNRAVVLARLPLWRVVLHLLGRAFVFASLYVWPWFVFPVASEGLLKPLLFAVVPITVYSLWFMACSQVNHHTDETSEAWDANWYRHQVMTSHTVAPDSGLAFLLSGGLNLQIEHHLFPAVNQVHLRTLQVRDGGRRGNGTTPTLAHIPQFARTLDFPPLNPPSVSPLSPPP